MKKRKYECGNPKLVTREEYDAMGPVEQGYVTYMQAEWQGSTIPKECPYAEGTDDFKRWKEGEFRATLEAQDSEE